MVEPTNAPVRNPFPGLRPFRTDEEPLFFGRERQIDRMVDKLALKRFLAVVGTSGSGKSSLVNCGLRPALHRGYMAAAGTHWRMATCRPGHDPIGALAQALAEPELLFDPPRERSTAPAMAPEELVQGTLRMSGLGLVDIVRQARLPAGTNLLLVVDQFEELFRYQGRSDVNNQASHGPGDAAVAFVKLLLEAVAQNELAIYVVLTMRSDFLGDCAQFRGLPEVMNEGQYLVPRLTRDEIRAAITGPVLGAQAQISPVLLTRLLNDVGDNPDQLSILQHALNRTWAEWEKQADNGRPLDLPHYEKIGGMQGALDQHAEKAFAELVLPGSPPEGAATAPSAAAATPGSPRQQLAARIFRTLTDKGTDARGIRRPTALADLAAITGASPAELEPVLAVFRKGSRSFLMPPEGEPLLPGTRIDISHESLLRVWQRLGNWADQEATAARRYRRLAETAALHSQGRAPLLSDSELDQALDWQRQTKPNTTWAAQYGGQYDTVAAFVQQSRDVRLAARVELEIERQWQARWRLGLIGAIALGFIVVQIALSVPLSAKLIDVLRLKQFMAEHQTSGRVLMDLLSHVLAGLPALWLYDFLAPKARLRHAAIVRPAVVQAISAAADAVRVDVPLSLPATPGVSAAPGVGAAAKAPAAAAAAAAATTAAAAAGASTAAAVAGAPGAVPPAPAAAGRTPDLARSAAAGAAGDPAALSQHLQWVVEGIQHAEAWAANPAALPHWGRRLAAGLIDLALTVVLYIFISSFFQGMLGVPDVVEGDMTDAQAQVAILTVLALSVIEAWSMRSDRQAPLGKRLMGLVVTNINGQRLTFLRGFCRHLVKLLTGGVFFAAWLPLTALRRTVPDRVAGTRVLRRPPKMLPKLPR